MQEKPEQKEAKKVRVKLKKTHTHGRKTYAPDAEIEVRADQAERLRAAGVVQ